jgi:thiol-disulfide isomerase/thioredoxin
MIRKSHKLVLLIMSILASLSITTNKRVLAESEETTLKCGKSCLSKGQYKQAVEDLESVVKKFPDSCEGHFLLGQAYCKLHNYLKGKDHYRKAIRVGHGSPNAQLANKALLALPRNMLAPKHGPETRMIAAALGIQRARGGSGSAKATVLDFYATWCAPCKQLKPLIERARAQYGDRVAFMAIDVDDPSNHPIVDQYEVSPIPTLIFLNPEGEVVTFSIGFSGDNSVTDGIKKVLSLEGLPGAPQVGARKQGNG